MTVTRYSVLTEPCVPVLAKGRPTKVGLAKALTSAHDLVGLSQERPLALAVLLRWMAALVLDSHGIKDENDVEELWHRGSFDSEKLKHYFVEHAEDFDLFHEERPLGQVARLSPPSGGKLKAPVAIQLTVASGNNVPLFSARTEGSDKPLPSDEAFLALLEVQGFDTAAIKSGAAGDPAVKGGKTTGNPTGPLGQMGLVIPLGRNLFETLLLNINTSPATLLGEDLPIWRRIHTPAWESRIPTGPLELLTWSSRRIRLQPSDDYSHVTGVWLSAGDRLAFTPEHEPHCRWKTPATKRSGVALVPSRWAEGQSAWRGLKSLLALEDESERTSHLLRQLADSEFIEENYPINLLCVGVVYGNQSAVIDNVIVDSLPLPVAALRAGADSLFRERLARVPEAADSVRRALNDLENNLREAAQGDRKEWDKGSHIGDETVYQLTAPTHRLLAGLQKEPHRYEEGVLAWEQAVHTIAWDVAKPLLDQAPPKTFAGIKRTQGKKERAIRLAEAEAWFRASLRKALPHLYAQKESPQGKE